MKEFLHGWRRKAGVVTLGVACWGMSWWVWKIKSHRISVGFDFFLTASITIVLTLVSAWLLLSKSPDSGSDRTSRLPDET